MLRNPRDIVLLVVIAVAIGFVLARIAPARSAPATPPPTATPSVALASPTPTPEPTDDDRVWSQPLISGCATANDVFLVSAGGGISRYDGAHWSLVDDTLRQLRAISCVASLAIAVGDGGRVVRVDPLERTVRPDTVSQADLYAVGASDPREIVVGGTDLSIVRLHNGRWDPIGGGGTGLTWRAILMRSATEVWLAGDAGVLFVFDGTKFTDRSIEKGPDLTALATLGADTIVGASDGRLYSVAPGRAPRELAKVAGAVRAVAATTDGAFVLADDLRHLTPSGAVAALPPKLSCPAVGLFAGARGDLWLLGRDGSRAGAARYDGTTWTTFGRC